MPSRRYPWLSALVGYTIWVVAAIILAYALLFATLWGIAHLIGSITSYISYNLANTLVDLLFYLYMFGILILGPRVFRHERVKRKTLGISLPIRFRDVPVAVVGMVAYFTLAAVLLVIAQRLFPTFNASQAQDLGVATFQSGFEEFFILLLFVVVGPIVEELIFRGYLYGNLQRAKVPRWLRVFVTSALFGVAHLQWNVGIDVFALSVMMCLAREYTGTIWAGILMHMAKNGLAFYLLYLR